jgi:replication-associated recombination protein RarA
MEQSDIKNVRRRIKPRIKLEDAPPVHSIKSLIELGRSVKFYKNLDTVMLWRITPYLEELDKMVGMDSLKETVFYQVIYYLQGMHTKNRNEEYLHTVIYGPPGSGKTTIAKIIGKIYQAMNILSSGGTFKVAYREDFVAGYLGQTAAKTKKLLTACVGGVLFIDEVYALAPRQNDRDSFAKEAIDTINAFLSEHKNDFCCIVAGYRDEVYNCFFAMNKGLERRFPWVHDIQEYTDRELYQIFIKMVKETGWDTAVDEKYMITFFHSNKSMFKNAGGDIETFLTKAKMVHSRRVFSLGKEHKFILTKDDINNAFKFLEKNKPKIDEPPPGLYT